MHLDVHFWEAVGFVLLVMICYKPVKGAILSHLNEYSQLIEKKVIEADNLYKEAESTLQHYTKQHKMFIDKIDTIAKKTEENIQSLKQQAAEKLEEKIKVKKQIHQDRVSLFNKQEMQKIKKIIIDQTMASVTRYLDDVKALDLTKNQITQLFDIVEDKSITYH